MFVNQGIEGAAQFRTTRWTVVRNAGHQDAEMRQAALEELCQRYWQPVFAFIRRQTLEPADAKDLTQAFFEHVLAHQTIESATPDKGRFRSFLLGALKRFLASEERKLNTVKRGGRFAMVALDEAEGEGGTLMDLGHDASPEKIYQRRWADALLEQAFAALRADYERAGKGWLFEALQPYLSGDGEGAGYKALGEKLGVSVGMVTTSVYRMRKRYGELLRAEIAHTVSSPEEIDEEINFLFAAVRD